MRLAAASLLYVVMVFGAGFLLGPVRVFWLEPRLGTTLAVLCEAPFLLAVMIWAARWVPGKAAIPSDRGSLAAIGVGALILQQIADFAVGTALRGLTPAEQLQNFRTGRRDLRGFAVAVCGNAVAGEQARKIASAIVVPIIRNMTPENAEGRSGRRGASKTAACGRKRSEPDNGFEIVPARPSPLLVA
jgi:hypothetical protein